MIRKVRLGYDTLG